MCCTPGLGAAMVWPGGLPIPSPSWAATPGFIGFAVGRTTFWESLVDYRAGSVKREAAVARIAASYRGWVDLFEKAK